MTSVSEVDWKIEPRAVEFARSRIAFEMLPLWASAKPPEASSANRGWTLRSAVSPVVE